MGFKYFEDLHTGQVSSSVMMTSAGGEEKGVVEVVVLEWKLKMKKIAFPFELIAFVPTIRHFRSLIYSI